MSKTDQIKNEALLIAKLRAETYQWFAHLFAKELSTSELELYQEGALNTILGMFTEIGLALEADVCKKAIAALAQIDVADIELRGDFAACFLLDEKNGANPYASLYLDGGMMYAESERKMRELLSKSGLAILETFKEPSDHLAIYLSLMEKWCIQMQRELPKEENVEVYILNELIAQKSFLDDGLLSWLHDWNLRLHRIAHCRTGFYQAMGNLLIAYIAADSDYLGSEIELLQSL